MFKDFKIKMDKCVESIISVIIDFNKEIVVKISKLKGNCAFVPRHKKSTVARVGDAERPLLYLI